MGLFEKVFYNKLLEDITTDVLSQGAASDSVLTNTDDYAEDDFRKPYIYGPDNKNNKKKKKKNKQQVFQRPEIVSYASGRVTNEQTETKR